jgi:cytidylate kinase
LRKITIAIDGFSSTGKSTLAKQLAKELNYSYVDTGAMYRAVALYAMKNDLSHKQLISSLDQININFKFLEETQANTTFLNGKNVEQEIRGMEVSNRVSEIATSSEVRAELVRQQKEMGKNKAVVMDGRDIGTVVFPDAELKIFMTADPEIRAKRRYDELLAKGDAPSFEEVYNNLQKRDNEDRNRLDSPLLQAKDALVLDNSEITHEQQFAQALDWAKEKITE